VKVHLPKTFSELSKAVLAVTSNRTGNTQIFVVDAISGDSRNVSRDPFSQNRYPMWSPDGSQIVFTSDRGSTDTYNLHAADLETNKIRQLTDVRQGGICYFPTWHKSLIYFGYAPGDGADALISRVNEDGSGFTVVATGRDPAISPDGKAIAFTRKIKTGYCVFTMNVDGTQVRRLTEHENQIGAVTPTWSPDGNEILYSDEVDSRLELFCCDRDGKNKRQLTFLMQFATSAAWSPDAQFITFRVTDFDYWNYPDAKEHAYKEKKAEKRPVWIMRADGRDAQILETLHYQCAIDGSRAPWKPEAKSR
jgi:TolB protein